jgi:hypothetical protein
MVKESSIYNDLEVGKNYFLPEDTENLYKLKKNFHSALSEICNKIEQKPVTQEKQILNLAYCLHENTPLKKAILGKLSDYSTPKSLENLAKMNDNISPYQIRKTKKKIKDIYVKEILDYKEKNSLLTYTNLQELKKINPEKDIEQKIVDTLRKNKKISYSKLAREHNLKDGRVINNILKKRYPDIYTNTELKEDNIPLNQEYKTAA